MRRWTVFFAAAFAVAGTFGATHIARAGTQNDAALVMDAETGRVLFARQGDSLRPPASLTKVMTLFLLFDAMRAGQIGLDDEISVSRHAASQDPSKLGLKSGDTISVEQAIYALVVRSANDVAVAVAEHLGGTEDGFAAMMTRKARSIGMNRTSFANASGLPNANQRSTARDLAVMSRTLMRDHPDYFRYFSVTSFVWDGNVIETHNNVLEELGGANGIKTGYTSLSGFNLITSVQRNNKRLIGVVLGGETAKSRDDEMVRMLEAWYAQIDRRPTLVASYSGAAGGTAVASAAPPAARPVEVAKAAPSVVPASSERIVAMAPVGESDGAARRVEARMETAFAETNLPVAPSEERVISTVPANENFGQGDRDQIGNMIAAGFSVAKDADPRVKPEAKPAAKAKAEADVRKAKAKEPKETTARAKGKWGIQIGAFVTASDAQAEIKRARNAAKAAIGKAKADVSKTTGAGGKTFNRARFVGFDKSGAQKACKALKADGFVCVAFEGG